MSPTHTAGIVRASGPRNVDAAEGQEASVRSNVGPSPAAVQTDESAATQIRELESKVGQLEQAVESHAVIDQAMGVLIAVGRISAAEAWDVLRETSMTTNIKVRHVAELVVTWGATGHLAADIRSELSRRLARTGI